MSFGIEAAKRLREIREEKKIAQKRLDTEDLTPEERAALEHFVDTGQTTGSVLDVGGATGPSAETMLLALVVLKLSKTAEGLKLIGKLGTEYLKGMFKTMSFLAQAGAANKISAWANPILISGVFQKWGMLPAHFNDNYHLGITVISGIQITQSIIDTVLDVLPWSDLGSIEPSDFPSDITFADGAISKITYHDTTKLAAARLTSRPGAKK